MPKVSKIDTNLYEYNCSCGALVRLETDEDPLKRVFKCFKCLKKFDFRDEDNE